MNFSSSGKLKFIPSSNDIIAGLMVFLIALPLSVGIALASGAPASAGIWSAIVGGIVGSVLGGSALTINGPAAGMIVVVLHAISDLGQGNPQLGFKRALAAFVIAGGLQVVFGKLRLGRFGLAIPGSVIHGMLTAIGVIIMTKQVYVALGIPSTAKNTLDLMSDFPAKASLLNPEVALIAAFGLIIVMAFHQFDGKFKRFIPVPLLVVLSGVFLARLFDFEHLHTIQSHGLNFEVSPKLLLAIPTQLATTIITPDFSAIETLNFWIHTVSIALIASIESLLSAAAVDKLDPMRRQSNMDRELVSKGICNMLLGAIGGLPIIAEMVRSKANVQNGAETKAANFIHGLAVLVFAILAPQLLNNIPLATFAAVLIPLGYALAHPSQFFHTAEAGRQHFSAFLVALVVTLASDLLIGVVAGLVTEMLWNVYHGMSPFKIFALSVETDRRSDVISLQVRSPLTFTNLLKLNQTIHGASSFDKVILDLTTSPHVDHTAYEHLMKLTSDAVNKGCTIELRFNPESKYHALQQMVQVSRIQSASTTH